ncbi:MAG: TonB-dependent receptor, partial [Bacteroidales bacterium]|nr:TonB-dependent receptor [Bacteroidales bacterium]
NLHLLFKYDNEKINYHRFNISIDLYHNAVIDKIVSVPRNNYFIWSMVNYGKVRIDGLELKADWRHERIIGENNLALWANLVYNYTYAIDNDKDSKYYKQQIQYTARNSANGMLGVDYGNISLSYALTAVGKRYWGKQNDDRYQLAPYCDQSLSLSYSFKQITLKLSCNNFTNEQYEVIHSYPMQGRQWIINLKYKFN